MEADIKCVEELWNPEKCEDFPSILKTIQSHHSDKIVDFVDASQYLVPKAFLDELKSFSCYDVDILFGATLRDIKCVVNDIKGREHYCKVTFSGRDKFNITLTSLPNAEFQSMEYRSIGEVVDVFKNYVYNLQGYCMELERIDRICCVMEPIKPTIKHNYRCILLDERVWLHVEVRQDGSATNVYLIGGNKRWHEQLQNRQPEWDHDQDIVDNIMYMFDMDEFPQETSSQPPHVRRGDTKVYECGICLCADLSDTTSTVPQPLCVNPKCDAYYHRDCLYKWLVESSRPRCPQFNVVTGQCPYCLDNISCSA